jgi:hypothetical protein
MALTLQKEDVAIDGLLRDPELSGQVRGRVCPFLNQRQQLIVALADRRQTFVAHVRSPITCLPHRDRLLKNKTRIGSRANQPLPFDLKFLGREGVCDCLLIETVERRPQREKCCDPLNNIAKPAALVIGQRFAVAAVGLTVAQPFLEYWVAAKQIRPNQLGHIGKVSAVVQVQITSPLTRP